MGKREKNGGKNVGKWETNGTSEKNGNVKKNDGGKKYCQRGRGRCEANGDERKFPNRASWASLAGSVVIFVICHMVDKYQSLFIYV